MDTIHNIQLASTQQLIVLTPTPLIKSAALSSVAVIITDTNFDKSDNYSRQKTMTGGKKRSSCDGNVQRQLSDNNTIHSN